MSRKILLIAGDSATVSRYAQVFERGEYELRVCDDPVAAVEMAAEDGLAAVLLSQDSPALSPLAILREIKAAGVAVPVVILAGSATVEAAVAAIREGAADYLREPCSAEDLRAVLRRIEPPTPAEPGSGGARVGQDVAEGFEGMLGQCPAMREVFALVRRIAPTESTVLVAGESGTGKEMVVRAIHGHSRRRGCPLLAFDCTALAPTLLESELFGHVKGSFSGAIATKKGLFEVAHRGTLFLDEVANLSLETQGKLLRVLESRRVRKVGDTEEHEVDIRLIATTNRSLAELVKAGAFRADLYYRLNVVPILLPPLRHRGGDIPLLANAFLRQFSRQIGVGVQGFSAEALRQMELYPWPGNVRELRNIVERVAVLYGGSRIALDHLPWEVRDAKPAGLNAVEVPRTWDELKALKRQIAADLERRFLAAALDRYSQNVTQAAHGVRMQRSNFHALLRSHGLRPGARPGK